MPAQIMRGGCRPSTGGTRRPHGPRKTIWCIVSLGLVTGPTWAFVPNTGGLSHTVRSPKASEKAFASVVDEFISGAVAAPPFTLDYRSARPNGETFNLAEDLGPLIGQLVRDRPASKTSTELSTSAVARMMQSLTLKAPPPLLARLASEQKVSMRAQPQYVPLLEAEDGSFTVAAHVLPFVKDRMGPANRADGSVILSKVLQGRAEVSYYDRSNKGGREECVCFGGECPRASCEWREAGGDGWTKVYSQSRVAGDGLPILVLHPFEGRAATLTALEPTVLLEVILKPRSATQSVDVEGTEQGPRVRMAEGATLLHAHCHHPPYKHEGPDLEMQVDSRGQASEDMLRTVGVGGLDGPFEQIFRRVFASRLAPKELVREMGVKHVRGLLLHGPPGCGKTLLARQMSKLLNSREPKIVNGPEVFGSLVGKSEENVRALFKEAEDEQRDRGDDAMLHVIILDEMDSICSKRGSHGSNDWRDSVVNQLLAKIDGVEALNNILLIGLTNRKDLIDEALLRPGRLEVHVEVGLPNEEGRQQILSIHTNTMRKHKRLDKAAEERLPEVARRTKNYSGAELEGLVKSSVAYAFQRVLSSNGRPQDITVTWQDIERSLSEMTPMFGGSQIASLPPVPPHFTPSFRPAYQHACHDLPLLLQALASPSPSTSTSTSTASPACLLALVEGPPGSGKSSLLSHLALSAASSFPFLRRLGPDSLLGKGPDARALAIREALLDSRQSNGPALILLDGLELLLQYEACLPSLYALLSPPPPGAQPLAVLAAWSRPDGSQEIVRDVTSRFHLVNSEALAPLTKAREVGPIIAKRLGEEGEAEVAHVLQSLGMEDGKGVYTLRDVHRAVDVYSLRKKIEQQQRTQTQGSA